MQAYKKSKIREAVLQVLRNTKTHPPADWVWEEVKKIHPSATLASIYRNLHILERIGDVFSFEVGQGEKRFDGVVHPHAHFVCKRCGRVYDCGLDVRKIEESTKLPGDVEVFQVTFYGICHACSKKRCS